MFSIEPLAVQTGSNLVRIQSQPSVVGQIIENQPLCKAQAELDRLVSMLQEHGSYFFSGGTPRRAPLCEAVDDGEDGPCTFEFSGTGKNQGNRLKQKFVIVNPNVLYPALLKVQHKLRVAMFGRKTKDSRSERCDSERSVKLLEKRYAIASSSGDVDDDEVERHEKHSRRTRKGRKGVTRD
jgi:hypothetical protein